MSTLTLQPPKPRVSKPWVKLIYWLIILFAVAGSALVSDLAYPYLQTGIRNYDAFLSWQWAHEPHLVAMFLQWHLALWCVVTSYYFTGWLIHRAVRKLKGRSWLIPGQDKRRHFLPNLLPFLRGSCIYFGLVWAFVILQYPLQFMMTH